MNLMGQKLIILFRQSLKTLEIVKEKRFASTDILKPSNQWWAKAKLITSIFDGFS
jgi:hypothetical protein